MAAHAALGMTLFALGAVATAHTHFAQGIALYDSQQHRAPAFLYGHVADVTCHSLAARALWSLGYPDQALARNHEMMTLVQQIVHPFGLGFALSTAAMFHQLCREVRYTQECAEAAISLAKEQGFPY
jgi:predicted ATPase